MFNLSCGALHPERMVAHNKAITGPKKQSDEGAALFGSGYGRR